MFWNVTLFLLASLCTGLSQAPDLAGISAGHLSAILGILGTVLALFGRPFAWADVLPFGWAGRAVMLAAAFTMISQYISTHLPRTTAWIVASATAAVLAQVLAGIARPGEVPGLRRVVGVKDDPAANRLAP